MFMNIAAKGAVCGIYSLKKDIFTLVLFIFYFYLLTYIFKTVPLGSIPELPGKSCAEIKTSEGNAMVNSKHWIYSDENADQVILATCTSIDFFIYLE